MFKSLHVKRVQRIWIILGICTACLVSVVCLAVPNGGPWEKSETQDCPQQGQVCADWDLSETSPWASCCIDRDYLGTSIVTACDTNFRHFHN